MAEKGRMANMFDVVDRLSTREKVLIGSLVGALVIALLGLTWWIVGRQIDDLEQRIAATQSTLTDVLARKDKFLADKNELAAGERRLEENALKLVRLMEDEANRLGITIENFKANRRVLTEHGRRFRGRSTEGEAPKKSVKELVEESQTVTMRKISLEQLGNFMRALEGQQEPVRVTRLSVATLNSDRQVLREVKMTVATYKKEEVEL